MPTTIPTLSPTGIPSTYPSSVPTSEPTSNPTSTPTTEIATVLSFNGTQTLAGTTAEEIMSEAGSKEYLEYAIWESAKTHTSRVKPTITITGATDVTVSTSNSNRRLDETNAVVSYVVKYRIGADVLDTPESIYNSFSSTMEASIANNKLETMLKTSGRSSFSSVSTPANSFTISPFSVAIIGRIPTTAPTSTPTTEGKSAFLDADAVLGISIAAVIGGIAVLIAVLYLCCMSSRPKTPPSKQIKVMPLDNFDYSTNFLDIETVKTSHKFDKIYKKDSENFSYTPTDQSKSRVAPQIGDRQDSMEIIPWPAEPKKGEILGSDDSRGHGSAYIRQQDSKGKDIVTKVMY